MSARPISRITFVLKGEDGRPHPVAEALCDAMAMALEARGVRVCRHTLGAPPEGALRADVAIWLPDAAEATGGLVAREAFARTHVLLALDVKDARDNATGFDAIWAPHESMVGPLQDAVERTRGAFVPDVIPARLPALLRDERTAEKAARGLGNKPVVMLDVREQFWRDIERVVFHLTLAEKGPVFVIAAPHDDKARARVRELCQRHALDAYLASGPQVVSASAPAVDVWFGRPRAVELLLLAAHSVCTAWLACDSTPPDLLCEKLLSHGAIAGGEGVLQLSATLDRLLGAAPAAVGTLFKEHVVGDARAFVDTLASVKHHVSRPRGSAVWERIGPKADGTGERGPVHAKQEPAKDAEKARADAIESALSALKARLSDEGEEAA